MDPSADILGPLLRRCDVVASCEELVAAAARELDVAERQLAEIADLGLVVQASVEVLELQARAYALWANRLADVDALLARDLRGLSAALERSAAVARKAREGADDLVASGDLEPHLLSA